MPTIKTEQLNRAVHRAVFEAPEAVLELLA